ncbi:MAG: class I SAM-dependent methyltransferase [Planctomycetota bacterium]
MSEQQAAPTTFQRSCRHWSEQSAGEMAAFYRLAAYDYTLLADATDWGAELTRLSQGSSGDTLSLLDVACGSGKFPAALLASDRFRAYAGKPIDYSLLDPSDFSLREAAAQLAPPFGVGRSFHCTLQDLNPPRRHDVVWATHALYCVPVEELPAAAERFCAALNPGGLGFIAQATGSSHYLAFQRLYLDHWPGASGARFSTADQVAAAMQQAGAAAFGDAWRWRASTIDYEGTLPLGDTTTAEMYLQRCLFDDEVTLDQMLSNERLGDYLRRCQDQDAGVWRFPQQTMLMRFGSRG